MPYTRACAYACAVGAPEAGGSIGHQPLALRRPNARAEVSLGRAAEDAVGLIALRCVARYHMVPRPDRSHPLADRLDNCPRLMSKDARKESFWVRALPRIDVRVAERVGDHLEAHLARLGWVDCDRLDAQSR